HVRQHAAGEAGAPRVDTGVDEGDRRRWAGHPRAGGALAVAVGRRRPELVGPDRLGPGLARAVGTSLLRPGVEGDRVVGRDYQAGVVGELRQVLRANGPD